MNWFFVYGLGFGLSLFCAAAYAGRHAAGFEAAGLVLFTAGIWPLAVPMLFGYLLGFRWRALQQANQEKHTEG